MMTVRDVIRYTQLSRSTIYRMVHSGELRSYRLGKSIRFKMDEVEEDMKNAKKGETERRSYSAF